MGRVAYLAFIAAVLVAGGYFAVLDMKSIGSGSLPSAIGSYEAVICLVSAIALFLDFLRNGRSEDALVD